MWKGSEWGRWWGRGEGSSPRWTGDGGLRWLEGGGAGAGGAEGAGTVEGAWIGRF